MKRKLLVLGAVCLLSVGLSSCGTKITTEEAHKLVKSYEGEENLKKITTISLQTEGKEDGKSVGKMITEIDLKDFYFYVMMEDPKLGKTEQLFTKDKDQYVLYAGGSKVVIPMSDAAKTLENAFDEIDDNLCVTTTALSTYELICSTGKISYVQDGKKLKFEASSADNSYSFMIDINEQGLMSKAKIKATEAGKVVEISYEVKYNSGLNKKTSI
ncbi:MAG: hypothetical protein RSB95_02865 [Bacilli bacterium]